MQKPRSPIDTIQAALGLDGDAARLRSFYAAWAGDYDRDVVEEEYVAPRIVVGMLPDVGISPDAELQVLDAGCGTGRVGLLLHERGFRNVDGFDLSMPMVEVAAKSGVYRHLKGDVDMNHPLRAFAPGSYDVILCCGVFTHGHVPPRSLAHLIRLGKPGGRILVSTRSTYCREQGYPQVSAEFVARGLLTLLLRSEGGPYTRDGRADYWAYRIEKNSE